MKILKKYLKTIIWGVISIALIVVFAVGCAIANKWSSPLTGFFGSVGASGAGSDATFVGTDTTQEAIDATAESVSRKIIGEGTVLIKNDNNALPVSSGSKVSVFGVTSAYWMTGEKPVATSNAAFTQALEGAGLTINTTLRSLYKQNAPKYGTGSAMGNGSNFSDWSVKELSQDKYTTDIKSSYSTYNDAAFVVFTRGGSEGSDLPMWMDAQGGAKSESYMSLTAEERDLLQAVTNSFSKVIVILHSANAMDMSFLSSYNVDSVIWVPGTGDTDLKELADLIVGNNDFSGRLVDTYVYDNMAANPSVQNFGDFRYVDASGNLLDYSYVNYAEGIYVGYKYYETRYEDVIMGTENAGNYDYSGTVAYPFGYGISYNNYSWSNMRMSEPDSNGDITVLIDVKNNGSLSGKDVVELYYQAPYTQYDIENGVEKASVNLIGFAKTDVIAAGGTQSDVKITFNVNDMASWDSTYVHDSVTGAYLMDEGTYYITAANDAHEAVNNILAIKEYETLTGAGETQANANSDMVKQYSVGQKTYITRSAETNALYKNNFADATLTDAAYLSRTNWTVVESGNLVYQNGTKDGVSNVMAADGKIYTHTLTTAEKSALEVTGWSSSGNPNDPSDTSVYGAITTGQSNGLKLSDMTGLSYNDEQWELLLDQMSLSDMSALFAQGGYGTVAINSVDKPETKEYDGPARILNLFSNEESYVYPAECMMAATWNTEILEEVGDNIGDQCLIDGISGWYAPAMNIHRTAFAGRNFEYYSEDSVLSGIMAAHETESVQEKGVYVYIKHFALNDQETNRGANGRYAAFSTEQAIREIYLKPFQIAVEDGNAHGVMASMNRVGYKFSITNYNLLTSTLREEWGFEGIVVTDYISSLDSATAEAGIAAGLDLQLITFSNPLSSASLALPGVQSQLREVAHHVLFAQANSLAVNGYNFGTPIYVILLTCLGIVICLYIALAGYFVIKYSFFKELNSGWMKMSKVDTIIACVAAGILLILLIIVAVWFFSTALPALKQAFTL